MFASLWLPPITTIALLFLALGQVNATGPYTSLGDLFDGQLASLAPEAPSHVRLGGQDFKRCCSLALNQSLRIVDGNVEFVPGQTFLHGEIASFLAHRYPCGATYNGSSGGPTQVTVPYSWCRANCDGWALSRTEKDGDWLESYVTFILPSLVFCFSIPRRRGLAVPDALFPGAGDLGWRGYLAFLYKVPLACLILLVDTVQLVVICIVMAGPMLLAGTYETVLDARVLTFLRGNNEIGPRARAHLLLVILIGNMDEHKAWDESVQWLNSFHIVDGCPGSATASSDDESTIVKHIQASSPQPLVRLRQDLVDLLDSQSPFGTTLGIGVTFFSLCFLYSISQIRAHWGQSATSYTLAFGCFWLTVGHVAVVAGVLLSIQNVHTWEDITAGISNEDNHVALEGFPAMRPEFSHQSLWARLGSLSSIVRAKLSSTGGTSRNKTAWMWDRGIIKASWLAQFSQHYPQLGIQENIIHMTWIQIMGTVVGPAVLLFLVPVFLAGMASYTTPTVGLSCRSLTPLLYAVSQMLSVILWVLNWRYWLTDRQGNAMTSKTRKMEQHRPFLLNILWNTLFGSSVFVAFVSAIGGTVFKLLGLFGNCLCWVPLSKWLDLESPDTTMFLGSNSDEQILFAKAYWMPIGVSATIFLIATTLFAWQYQQRRRAQFKQLVHGIGKPYM